MKKIVVALGGNALGDTPSEQVLVVKKTVHHIIELIKRGHKITVVHGNGPQVGMISQAFEVSNEKTQGQIPLMPLAESIAMSQGYIGMHLQNELLNQVKMHGLKNNVITVLTQVVVDKDDKAFQNPSKPIGSFLTLQQADKVMKENPDLKFVEDSGRGYRLVVASPKPLNVVEKDVIKTLMNEGCITVSCGGGGVPVTQENGSFKMVQAVIDKDKSAALLADEINADMLLIITGVDNIAINYNKPNQEALKNVSVSSMVEYSSQGQFAAGSMLPKVEAAIDFISDFVNREAVITSIDRLADIDHGAGTRITLKG